MAYDIKLREAVLKHLSKGNTIRDTAETFEISTFAIKSWRRLLRETGSLQDRPKAKERRHKKIDPVKLRAYYEENPDSYLHEAAAVFSCCINAISKARKRLNITRKKTKQYVERCEAKRAIFQELISTLSTDQIYYIDETGIDTYLYREYAYAPRGQRVMAKISGKKFKRTNIVAAKCNGHIVAPMIYDGTTDAILFEHWFEHALLKVLPKGSYCVLDNAAFHRKAKLHTLAEKVGCFVVFLPPYSPDLNPIEKHWATLKAKLRNILHEYEDFFSALCACF